MNFNAEQFTATQQANLNVASKELERQKQLFQKQYISQGALDRAQAQWEAARAQVQAQQAQTRAAQTQTGFFSVRAPFNGVVSDVAVTLGDMAMPGRPMLTMHDPSALRVSAAVPQSMLSGVRSQLASVRYEIAGHSAQPVQHGVRAAGGGPTQHPQNAHRFRETSGPRPQVQQGHQQKRAQGL